MRQSAQQVAVDICRRVALGELHPGDKLPSPDQLAREYRLSSPGPVKSALGHLQDHSVLRRQTGSGSFIAGDVLDNPVMLALIEAIELSKALRQRVDALEEQLAERG